MFLRCVFLVRTPAWFPRNLTFVVPETLRTSRLMSQAVGMCCGATEMLAWALVDSAEHGEHQGADVWNLLSISLVPITDNLVV